MGLENKCFKSNPKLRHNLWTVYEDNPEITIMTFSQGDFEIPTKEANKFIQIRSYCTGFNTIDEIAEKSNLSSKEVKSLIDPLIDVNVLHLPFKPLQELTDEQITSTLLDATRIWGEQLADTSISREIFLGRTSKNVLLGWLLETYHYVKDFPEALLVASNWVNNEKLKSVITKYAHQEKGHEEFIAKCLIKAGLSREEIEESIPLVSTRSINFLLKEIFALEPITALLVASIIEASEFDEESASDVAKNVALKHNLPEDLFDSFLHHINVDNDFGHQRLFIENLEFIKEIDRNKLHDIVNKIHDIKHAFDLQKLEIKDYYEKAGNYFPRQKVDFFAI